jgi:predicted unusual protein kinase regulating ubiquinone biosynthesis (AarF/ABC1/UbiB family)
MADDEVVTRLLARLMSEPGENLPTGLFGRARRTASAALRSGTSALLRGGKLDARTAERLALSLGELKGIAMKVGQILSYLDTPLPEETRRVLAVLQVKSQPTPFEKIEQIIREDFGTRADALLSKMDRVPVSTASIGQVHRAGGLAVKVLHPGIEQAIRSDFKAAAAGRVLARMIMPGGDIDSLIEEAREAFLAECDYVAERRWQERFGALHADNPDVSIPAVHGEWCSRRVITTTWVDGMRFDDFAANASQAARDRAGRALYEFYVGSVYRHGLFNADPHPGNLLFAEDGRLTVLDYGCVREFDERMRAGIKALSRAVRADDEPAIRRALVELGGAPPGDKTFPHTRSMLRGFFGPTLERGPHRVESGFNAEMRTILVDKRAVLRMRLPGRLLFLFRIRFGLHSEIAKLRSVADWAALETGLAG